MTRDEIVYSTYEAGRRLNRLKARFGLVDAKTAEAVEKRIDGAVAVMKEIDRAMALPDPEGRKRAVEAILMGPDSLYTHSIATVCGKKELEWPTHFLRINLFRIIRTVLGRRRPNVLTPSPPAGTP
jgi:hypothetical protein